MKPHEFASRAPDEVLNQPPALEDYNLYEFDTPLREALHREGGGWIEEQAMAFGELLGRAETLNLGELANRHLPELRSHDRFGHRIDEVEFHPAYHELMRIGVEHRNHSLPWINDRPGGHVARAALNILRHQVDEGTSCPISMAFAVVPALRLQPELAAEWEPRMLTNEYDPRPIPVDRKRGAMIGLTMTERQGGSDVRANTSRATSLSGGGPGQLYQVRGHKWFCSAPMCDAFLILAQAPGGLSCFLLPRWKQDGSRNAFHIMRLKDKLGNRSNASSEVEFQGAWAWLIGEEGRGVANIMEMVRLTRFDCIWASAATMRRAVAEATHHANYRFAFGRRLIAQPLMQNVLADLCLESEAATALTLRLARGLDEAPSDEGQRRFIRLALTVGKYWVTRRAMAVVAEAMECVGGNGYVEESPLACLYRDAPLNSIWEGAGNVQCLDVLRAMRRDLGAMEIVLAEIEAAQGADRHFDAFAERLKRDLANVEALEVRARRLVERLALALQGAVLVQHAPPVVADAFCVSRLAADRGLAFGTLPAGIDFKAIIDRSLPRVAEIA
ncbi:MAG: isovaleryl-CoA dehydrogenase [Anaerolineae bacterium]